MKSSKVQPLLDARKLSYSAKDTKYGEIVYNAVLFRKIAKITESIAFILVEFPFGEFPKQNFKSIQEFEAYLDSGGKW